MRPISGFAFDIVALALPRGLGFGANPPVGAWISDDGSACGIVTKSTDTSRHGVILLRRRVDDVWSVLRHDDATVSERDALHLVNELCEAPAERVPLPPGSRRRPFLWDTSRIEPSDVFKALGNPTRQVGAWTLNQLYLAFPNPDANWASDCQTGNFHTRLWEAHLLAVFREQGLLVQQTHPSPDFRISNWRGDDAWVEAVTANPPEPFEHYGAEPADPPQERRERALGSAAARFARTIRNKLEKRYSDLPHVAGKCFALALADFHAPGSMLWSREALVSYLYGIYARVVDRDGRRIAEAETISTLLGDPAIPAGLFRDPSNADVSAVVFTNACSIAKLSRVGISAGATTDGCRYVRIGEFFDRSPGALRGIPFSLDVGSAEYRALWTPYRYEPWSAEIEVFHNPMARHPMPIALLREATHWREIDGEISCTAFFATSVLKSHTLILNSTDAIPTPEQVEQSFRYTFENATY